MVAINCEDMTIIRGDTETFTVSCDDYDFVTGDSITMTIRKNWSTITPALSVTVTSFSDDGSATITLAATSTKTITPGIYKYDVQLTKADGTVYTIIGPANLSVIGDMTYES